MIECVKETGSTNADLSVRIRDGENLVEGDWLVADRQSAGKGRLGRVWNDGYGNFMGSTIIRPQFGDPPTHTLALMSGLAVHSAVSTYILEKPDLRLKWPNDLMLGGAKLSGILLEVVSGAVIVGIGVNLAHAPDVPDRKITSLSEHCLAPERDAFAATLSSLFNIELERWRKGGLAPLLRRWQSAAHPIGTPLWVNAPGEPVLSGTFAGLTDDGSLKLSLANGTTRAIYAGDILLTDR